MRSVFLILLAIAMTGTIAAAGAAEPIFMKRSWDHAVNGYDVVAYHKTNTAVRGLESFATDHLGATWLFSSAANRDAFIADPDAYRPQYGGHCAWAMAKGKSAAGDPDVWHIHNGKLYLNVSNGIKKRWLRDIDGFIERADAQWPEFVAKHMQ